MRTFPSRNRIFCNIKTLLRSINGYLLHLCDVCRVSPKSCSELFHAEFGVHCLTCKDVYVVDRCRIGCEMIEKFRTTQRNTRRWTGTGNLFRYSFHDLSRMGITRPLWIRNAAEIAQGVFKHLLDYQSTLESYSTSSHVIVQFYEIT